MLALSGMPTRISPRRQRRIYLAEWREARGLTQEALADLLKVAGMTVSRWERGGTLLNTDVMAALAEALGIEPVDLYRHPNEQSLDAMLRDAPDHVKSQAAAIIEALKKSSP
jgi:transcriptional regulator with XRE-family HTH domain